MPHVRNRTWSALCTLASSVVPWLSWGEIRRARSCFPLPNQVPVGCACTPPHAGEHVKRAPWHLRVGAIVAAWLLVFVALSLADVSQPIEPWLVVHVLLFGAVSNAILIWSRHFADALLRLPEGERRRSEGARLALFNLGVLSVVVGKMAGSDFAIWIGAAVVVGVLMWHAVALSNRMKRARSSRFLATLHYYIAATLLLLLGVALGAAMTSAPSGRFSHSQLEFAHVAVNVLG